MRTEIDPQDIEAIASRVVEILRPLLSTEKTEDVIYDVKGLCSYLNVSEKWVYERTHYKEIPHLKVNGLLRFRKRDIDKWLNSHNVPTVNAPVKALRSAS